MSIKASKRRKKQIIEDSWSIDYAFCKWIVPRLDLLIRDSHSYPIRFSGKCEKWKETLEEMKEGFQIYAKMGSWGISNSDLEKVNKSLELFNEYFYDLWD